MKKTFFHLVLAGVALFVALMSMNSCVNERYEISQDRLDLNVTVFQEGVCLPLGSTEMIRLGSIIDQLELEEDIKKYLMTDESGAYSISYKAEEPLDMSEDLKSLTGMVDVDKIDFGQSIDFSLTGLNVDDISYPGASFGLEDDISEYFGGYSIKIDQFSEQFSIDAKLRDYKLDNVQWDLSLGDHGATPVFATLPDIVVPDVLLTDAIKDREFSISELNTYLGSKTIGLKAEIEDASVEAHLQHSFPKEVESVSDIHLAPGAKLKITVQMEDPFFSSGSVTPHMDINLETLMHLADESGKVHDDHIDTDFVLSYENGWRSEGVYNITGLVVDPDHDWSTEKDAEGNPVLWFDKTVTLAASGLLVDGGLKTTPALLKGWLDRHPGKHDIGINVKLEFVDFTVDDVTLKFKPIPIEREEIFEVDIPQIKLPAEAKKIENVTFDQYSGIDFELSVSNVANIGDIDFNVSELELTFPESMQVEGAVNNKLVIPGQNLSDGNLSKNIKILGFELGEPNSSGIIPAQKAEIHVVAKAEISGEVHTARLPQTKETDIQLHGEVAGNLTVDDYDVVIAGYTVSSETDPGMFPKEEVKIEVPKEVADIQGLSIRLKDSPEITINIKLPDVSFDIRPLGPEGLVVKFPQMLSFKKGGYAYENWYDSAKHALVFPSDRDFPEELRLPVDCILVDPVEDADGKYYAVGAFEIAGTVGIKENTVMTKEDMDILSASGTKLEFKAVVPKLEPESVGMSSYTSHIESTFEFKPLEDADLPEMLVSVGQIVLDDVYLSFGVKTGSNFPSLGEDASLSLGVDITLPDFIKIDDERFENGRLSMTGLLEKGPEPGDPMELIIDPIKIESLDLNMSREQLSELEGTIEISGNVSLTGASLVLDEWVDKTNTIEVVADLKTMKAGQEASDKIEIAAVTGNVDYQIEPVDMTVDLSELSQMLEEEGFSATIDLSTFYIALDMTTNLGIPVKASLDIIPYYGREQGTPVSKQINVEPAESAQESKTTRIWISKDAPDPAEGYQFVDVDIFSMLYKDESKTDIIDSLKIMVNAGTDPDVPCRYEPSAEYTLVVDYAAGVPLAFGEDFEIAYKATVEDLPEMLGEVMEYGACLGLGGQIESSLPFTVNLSAKLLDSKGNVVGWSENGTPLIKSADMSGNAVTTDVDLRITPAENIDYKDIKAVEIEFSVNTKYAPDVPLREDSYIKINSFYARIPEGISLDLGEQIPSKEETNE